MGTERKLGIMQNCIIFERNGRYEVEFPMGSTKLVKAFDTYVKAVEGIVSFRELNPKPACLTLIRGNDNA